MKRRAELALVLERFVQRRQLTQPQAAKLLGVSQPSINDLLRGRLHRFSVDSLLIMMDRAQIRSNLRSSCQRQLMEPLIKSIAVAVDLIRGSLGASISCGE